ncbi:YqaE/Pmp3 family membrane protein [Agaribacter flavus]|uniref:YqaE/Pmp3 family membrane protein n=1 Tax=Agaribacter flavus TaxID=1902781 RepID=A0ABV7FTW3_9ALTE
MRYLLAIIPPIAVLFCGKPIQALLNLILTLLFYIPGVIHALIVVHGYYADRRTQKVVDAINKNN